MPSLIPGYEYDIFISYRQKDNKYDGWVTEFVSNLKKELEATFKDDVSIYFDENPHDGLLETHNVNLSLEGKLKSLIIIPIISQTYCDPKSFAWQHEFVAFLNHISEDRFGTHVRVANGNIASRILPVRIHDLDQEDIALFESTTKEVMRPVDFIYRLPGVNRQLRAKDDEQVKSPNQTLYRDQINKVAHAIKDIVNGLKNFQGQAQKPAEKSQLSPEVMEKPVNPDASANNQPKGIRTRRGVILGVLALLLVLAGFFLVPSWLQKQKARKELLPAIQKLVDENFAAPSLAFEMATEAARYIPDDSALIKLWPKISRSVSFQTQPEGAEVYWKAYERPGDPWKKIGTTPLKGVRVPYGIRLKIEKPGFNTLQLTSGRVDVDSKFKLDSLGSIPDGMVRIPARVALMNIIGLEQHGGKKVPEFLIDRYEVSNRDYKKFIEAGGYQRQEYWKMPMVLNGKPIAWAEGIKMFVDKTGRPGPSTWEAGTYPNGKEDHPVAGVSWYEASAYAAFAGKSLPTVYHWSIVAETGRTVVIIPLSNFNGTGTAPVGSHEGISSFGIYDLAGNVREWCANEVAGNGQYNVVGGGWNDPTYAFNDAGGASPMDRSLGNGFRCIKLLPGDETLTILKSPLSLAFRDYKKEKPVDDKTFEIIARQFQYDKSPLNAQMQPVIDSGMWKVEKVTMDAGYGNDKLFAYLFLPRDAKPPFQPVIYFPGSNVIYEDVLRSFHVRRLDFFIKSGRAIILPIFKGTFERRDELNSDLADESVFYRDHVIMWRKDLGRTIDYIETREDIISDQLGYFGWSWGGFMGGILPALEPRIKAVVLHVGGMEMNKALPEVDQINFLPRVHQPVLMLNGKHDMFFPVETAQRPMFELLGTDAKDKKILIYDAGHLVPRTELIKESLAWFDQYLGKN